MYLRRFAKEMSKFETSISYFLALSVGWLLGRFTEAVALGNIGA